MSTELSTVLATTAADAYTCPVAPQVLKMEALQQTCVHISFVLMMTCRRVESGSCLWLVDEPLKPFARL